MKRQEIEKKIVASVIADLLEADFLITVNDGEEDVLLSSDDPEAIAAAMMSTDEDYLMVDGPKFNGWVRFIYGNDGPDVISDYTVNLEQVIARSIELAEQLEDEI